MKRTFVHLLAVGALASPAAWAQTTGQATIQNVTFELIDLAPGDGVDPTLTWLGAATEAGAHAESGTQFSFASDGTWTVSFLTSGDGAHSAPLLFGPGQAVVQATSAAVQPGGLAASFATGATGGFQSVFAFSGGSFVLSQQTELRVGASFGVAVSGPAGSNFAVPAGTPADFAALHSSAMAFARIDLIPLDGGGASTAASFQELTVGGLNYTPSNQADLPVAGYQSAVAPTLLTLTLTNDSNAALAGDFFAQVSASGQQIVATADPSPVPEPGSWATLAAGLAALGWTLRRRTAHRR